MAEGAGGRPGVLDEVVRFLRQQEELGLDPVVLEALDRTEVGRLVAAALRRPTVHSTRGGEGERPPAHAPASKATPSHAPESKSSSPGTPAQTPVSKPTSPADPPSAAARPDSSIAVEDLPDTHDALRELALGCTRCGLSEDRTQVVFHDGNPEARLMVVGEAPGANEDRTGVPFVGAAGQFLDLILATVGLSREDSVYICNVIKCRPPGNRNPKPDEIAACAPYLKRQIEVVKPEAILAVGTFSAQLLTGKDIALGRIRGEVYSYEGTPLVVTYHPAALLRNSGWVRPTWADLQLLRGVLDGTDA